MWVLTRSINQYDQDGDYFVAVFKNHPTITELDNMFDGNENFSEHLYNGGGRIGNEREWYNLTEINSGEEYKPK